MDQVIEQEVRAQKKKKGLISRLIVVFLLVGAIWLVRAALKNTVKKSDITTAIVGVGSVENILNASGEVIPEFEEIRRNGTNT